MRGCKVNLYYLLLVASVDSWRLGSLQGTSFELEWNETKHWKYCSLSDLFPFFIPLGAVVVVILWYLDLQLPVQLVPITTKGVSSDPAHGAVYSIQQYVIKFVSDLRQIRFFSRYSGFLHQ
jgi:hypothetical protein